jgi:hypothetical protein
MSTLINSGSTYLNSIDKKKELKENTNEDGSVKKTNKVEWGKFALSVLGNALHLLVYMYIASSVIYSIKNLGTDEFFPTDPKKPPYVSGYTTFNNKQVYKNVGFPYGFYDKSNPSSLLNYVVNIIKYSWTTERSVTKSLLKALNEGFNILDHYDFGTMDSSSVDKIKQVGVKVISYIYIMLAPYVIMPGLVFLSSLSGYIAMVIAWVTKAPDMILKLLAVMTILLFVIFISPIFSIMNFIQGLYTFVILLFMPLLKDYKHLLKFFGEYSGFISLLFIIMVISASNSYLPKEVTIGLVVGLILMYGGTILHFLFGGGSKTNSNSR